MVSILLFISSLLFTIFFYNVVRFRDTFVFGLFIGTLFIPVVGLVFGITLLIFLPLTAYDCDIDDMICIRSNKFTKWLFNGAYQSNGSHWYNSESDE